MSDQLAAVQIPDKSSFKPSDVCELVGVPPYVLRTWENEFETLGVATTKGATRTYRRKDVELALRIKDLVFAEHLTLAGVRRRLEQEHVLEAPPEDVDELTAPGLSTDERARLTQIKNELRSLLQTLASGARGEGSTRPSARPEGQPARNGDGDEADEVSAAAGSPDEADAEPVLPGLGAQDAPTSGGRAASSQPSEPHLDPAALDFATVVSPGARAGRRSRLKG